MILVPLDVMFFPLYAAALVFFGDCVEFLITGGESWQKIP